MSGIAGFFNPSLDVTKEEKWKEILLKMNQVQKRRGVDDEGIYLEKGCGLAHVRLASIDLVSGHQPMIRKQGERTFVISFDGEIYNMNLLREQLKKQGEVLETTSDTEVILLGYMREGLSYIERLNGVFSIALWDSKEETLHLIRDRLGVKPLFYTMAGEVLVFSSEIKGLFSYPNVEPVLDKEGLCEIFALGPAKTYGKGVFHGVKEVLSGHILTIKKGEIVENPFWELKSVEHTDSLEETIEKTEWLLNDAIQSQMIGDVPICTFLSGGIDSSLVTAICAKELEKKGKKLDTFSFDFQGNQKYFKANNFQPSRDRPYVDRMVEYSNTNHHYLECDNMQLIEYLSKAVDARDLPCMADVESSMLYFCSKVAPISKIALTGECADEIFGGYPWFHKKEMLQSNHFPWSMSMEPRQSLLRDEIIKGLPMQEYADEAYQKTIDETPALFGESKEEKRRREIAYLNLKWFMVTLLDRMERTSMYAGLGARVPFADYRIVEYVFNVPWEMKCTDGIVKGLLRHAGEKHLPADVLWRKKSPYPKTYHPEYEKRLGAMLKKEVEDISSPIRAFVDPKKLERFIESPSDYGKPWYGQLMAGPQMLAYLLQINYWIKKYDIKIREY